MNYHIRQAICPRCNQTLNHGEVEQVRGEGGTRVVEHRTGFLCGSCGDFYAADSVCDVCRRAQAAPTNLRVATHRLPFFGIRTFRYCDNCRPPSARQAFNQEFRSLSLGTQTLIGCFLWVALLIIALIIGGITSSISR